MRHDFSKKCNCREKINTIDTVEVIGDDATGLWYNCEYRS